MKAYLGLWVAASMLGCARSPLAAGDTDAGGDLAAVADLGVADLAPLADLSLPPDLSPPADLAVNPALRQLAPLSTSLVTSRQPRLTWSSSLSGPTSVELCADRACKTPVGTATVDASGTSALPDANLPAGAVFWRLRQGGASSVTWEFFVGPSSSAFDHSWGSVSDFDGDGHPELAFATDSNLSNAPKIAWVYHGSATGILGNNPIVLTPTTPDGTSVLPSGVLHSAGDLDGDGFPELALAGADATASVYYVAVYAGGPSNLGGAPVILTDPTNARGNFGNDLTPTGDLDGDGYADLVIAQRPLIDTQAGGDVHVYRGGPDWRTSAPISLHDATPGFATAVAACDTDGDGRPEILVSAESGEIFTYGLVGGNLVQKSVVGRPGHSLARGDFNGDGRCDLLAGDSSMGVYNVDVLLGASDGFPSPSPSPQAYFEAERGVLAGDVDGDGVDDFFVTTPLHYGDDRLILSSQPASGILIGNYFSALGGLAGLGDVDGDGYGDVAAIESDSVFVYSGAEIRKGALRPPAAVTLMPAPGANLSGGIAGLR